LCTHCGKCGTNDGKWAFIVVNMVQNDGKYGTNDGKWAFIVVSMVQNDCKTNLVKTFYQL